MALTANPFHPVTGELLPSYRDAYLRGDLSGKNIELVDAYLKAHPTKGTEAFQRFHAMQHTGHSVQAVGWVGQQLHLIRTEPARFRRRAGSLVLVGALLTGAVFAASGPAITTKKVPLMTIAAGDEKTPALVVEAAAATTTVRGRILDEKGRPLVGATILDKRNGRGVSTDAQGNYALSVPRNQDVQLQFGYGGYQEENVLAQGPSMRDVKLLPRTDLKKKHRWLFF